MAPGIVDVALEAIAQYGLVAIFILLVLDAALLLPVFPGEIVLIMAVAAYADGPQDLLFLVAITTAAGLVGSLILYGVTRGGGRRLVERFPRFFMMPRRRRERLERSFQRPVGQSLVLFLRLIPFTRILVNIPAGLARMPVVRFVVLSTVGLGLYHAGFLWFTFEANRPGSELAAQQQQLQDAYASPAWEFVQTNTIVTGLALVVIGIILSVRASTKMYRDPEEPAGSLLGSLATLVLFWGGIALAVVTYMDPPSIYALARLGGVDIQGLAAALGFGPVQVLLSVAATGVFSGLLLARLRRAAIRRHKAHKKSGEAPTPRTFELLAPPEAWGSPRSEPPAPTRSDPPVFRRASRRSFVPDPRPGSGPGADRRSDADSGVGAEDDERPQDDTGTDEEASSSDGKI